MATNALSDEERQRIEGALRSGASLSAVAKRFKRGKATVSRIAAAAGIDLERSATKKATNARRDYATATRVQLLNRFFDKAAQMLDAVEDTTKFKDLATGLAILVDKRRLEDGEATDRTETHDSRAKDELKSRIDELARRRQTDGVA